MWVRCAHTRLTVPMTEPEPTGRAHVRCDVCFSTGATHTLHAGPIAFPTDSATVHLDQNDWKMCALCVEALTTGQLEPVLGLAAMFASDEPGADIANRAAEERARRIHGVLRQRYLEGSELVLL